MRLQKYWRSLSIDLDKTNQLTIVLFTIYMFVLLWILLLKFGVRFTYMEERSVNLIPFSEALDRSQLILNVVFFIPLGIYAEVLFKKWTLWNRLFFVFLTSLMVEGLQYVLRIGALDTTDIITNSLGGLTGLLIYVAIEKLFNNSVRSQKFINIIAGIGTVIMVSLLILLKLNMLPVRYQ